MSTLRLPAWVATMDLHDGAVEPAVAGIGEQHRSARLLLTRGGAPVEVVDVPVVDGRPDLTAVRAVGATPPDVSGAGPLVPLPTTTVAVCTHDRPEHLAVVLDHLQASPADDTEDTEDTAFLVVDNAPSDARTRRLVEQRAERDRRLHYVREPRAGLSRARNRALAWSAHAGHELTVFVDDDVTMRRGWLAAVRTAAAGVGVACVTGPVVAGTLETPVQLASDGALGWTDGFGTRRFSLDDPSGSPLFPFAPGEFGVGANFAVRTRVAQELGGFDVHLGAGSPTKGGEDIEFWVRLVCAGHTLAYTPSTWLWHHHRDTDDALRAQLAGYALGLGGYLAAVAHDRRMRRLAARRLPGVVSHLLALRGRERAVGVAAADGGLALRPVLRGARTYTGLRWRGWLGRRGRGLRRSRRTGS